MALAPTAPVCQEACGASITPRARTALQVVAQALSRTEIPEEMADVDVLPEVFQQLGYSRLLVLPHAQEHFAGPVAQFRKGRSRTVAAWGFIKHLVYHGDQPEQRALNQTVEIFSTVHPPRSRRDFGRQIWP